MILTSWNIDSLNAALTSDSKRAVETREVLDTINKKNPDFIAIQETKLRATGLTNKHQEILKELFPDYDYVWRSSEEPARKSYAGTMFLYKKEYKPIVSYPKIDAPEPMDSEGRILTFEFDNFYLTQVYTPNSGNGLRRLSQRQIWDKKYCDYLKGLDKKKPVIASGDFNVAFKAIDLKHPENNHHNAGFTDEEREKFGNLLDSGFTDTFRSVHGNVKDMYSWWAQRVITSKDNNSGWRIDYFIVSNRIVKDVRKSEMIDSKKRRDHCPILLDINLK